MSLHRRVCVGWLSLQWQCSRIRVPHLPEEGVGEGAVRAIDQQEGRTTAQMCVCVCVCGIERQFIHVAVEIM